MKGSEVNMLEMLGYGQFAFLSATPFHSNHLLRHNAMPSALPPIESLRDGISTLLTIIRKHQVQSWAQVTLNHRHTDLPPNHILATAKVDALPALWTAPTSLTTLNLFDAYPSVLIIRSGSFAAVELRMGCAPPSFEGKEQFFEEFAACICSRGWQDIFGLGIEEGWSQRIEFLSQAGNLLVEDQAVDKDKKAGSDFIYTRWAAGDEEQDKTGITACFVFPSGHVKVTDTRIRDPYSHWDSLERDGYFSSVKVAL
ncbi:uncharacterized protein PV09_09850 [Verruconis gallopava]|uniref:Uncharacterized protein n=1 Tax=Verruconis gallopava TaxID=253628 RepID=A0A0D1ZW97_9PEZI|nr:uncharacterized protein PV09_09850 [Verruconis gallopava]KIV98304.1 hypothetical protein PV09_09850 [Verruconis gallopava]